MGKPEANVEDYLRDRVKALGGEVRKVKWIARRGAPDDFVMLPCWQWSGFVECKAEGKDVKHDSQQEREIELLRACGINAEVVASRQDVDDLLFEIEGAAL